MKMPKVRRTKEEYVYERLGLKECLIISKTKKDALVACNEDGNIRFKRIEFPKKEETPKKEE